MSSTPAAPVTVTVPPPTVTTPAPPADADHPVILTIDGEVYDLTPHEALKLGSDLIKAGYAAWVASGTA